MSGDDDLIVKADFADGFCLIRAAGHDDAVLAVRHQRMVIIHGVDLAETGKIAVFDIDARDVVLALCLRLGAVLFLSCCLFSEHIVIAVLFDVFSVFIYSHCQERNNNNDNAEITTVAITVFDNIRQSCQ